MANILLVDTNFSAAPIYRFLKVSGHKVTILGGNKSDSLAKNNQDYHPLDYSEINKVNEFIKNKKIDFVVPGCNDLSYEICSKINKNQIFGRLSDVTTTSILNNKSKFRSFAASINLPIPKVFHDRQHIPDHSVIVKPVDSYSGKGVSVVHKPTQEKINDAIRSAEIQSRTNIAIVEEFVVGQLYSHSAFLENQQVTLDYIVREDCSVNPFAVDTSILEHQISTDTRQAIRKDVNRIAKSLNLCDGLLHTQFIYNRKQYWFIETTRRCPGDLYSDLIYFSTGHEYCANYVRNIIGEPIIKYHDTNRRFVIRHTLQLDEGRTLDSISIQQRVTLLKLVPLQIAGNKQNNTHNKRIAIIFIATESEQEAEMQYKNIIEGDLISVNNY